MTDQQTALELRVARLERAATRWRIVAISSVLGVLLLAAAPGGDAPKELTVQSLTVKSPAGTGHVRITPGTIEVEREGARILLKTDGVAADGRAAVEVLSDGHESLLRSGRLALVDSRRQLFLEARSDMIQLYEGKKDAAAQLINREDGAALFIGAPGNNAALRPDGVEVKVDGKRVAKFPAAR